MISENNRLNETSQPAARAHTAPRLNKEQEKAAYCEKNAVVAAGAGSGKTMVLASRFVYLVTEKGIGADEILTLTFTKKAAGQMFTRIYSLLSEIAQENSGEKSLRAKKAIDNIIHARIQTLDSYSAALVKTCASRYGISPMFEINPQRSREIALEESLPFLITNRQHPAIEKLYSENSPDDIARNIFPEILDKHCLLDRERDFTDDIKKQFKIILFEWEKMTNEIGLIVNGFENNMTEINEMCGNLFPVMEEYKKNKIKVLKTAEIKSFFDLLLQEDHKTVIEKAESHPVHRQLHQLLYFIMKIYKVNTIKGKPKDNPVKEKVKKIKACYEKFSSLVVYCMQAGFIYSFMSLLNELQKNYLHRKRTEGILTFNDVSHLARTILMEQKDIRQSEKETFKAVMIDEFQDNNELQKDLLFLLAEKKDLLCDNIPKPDDLCEDKLFFVGDEKQSVYLFRDADVSVFRKLKNDIKGVNLSLKINYRSCSSLIGAFNAIFGGSVHDPYGKAPLNEFSSVFAPEKNEKLPLYEASYAPLETIKEKEGSLSICILNGSENEESAEIAEGASRLSDVENEARYTAEQIEKLLQEKKEDGKSKYQPNDIAILFRSHSPQFLFEKHLRLLGIPYATGDINDLFYGGVVNDIMSVLRLAAYPLDTTAYAQMLRSPFTGLSLNGTAVCLSVFREADSKLPFNDDTAAFLDDNDRERYENGKKIYESICSKASGENAPGETSGICALLDNLWSAEGYRYETQWHPNTGIYGEYYDYLYHLAVIADNASQGLAAFTDYINSLRSSGERLKDIDVPLDRSGAVHLMTVHKSKGLEFPVVFVCCCGKHGKRNQDRIVYESGEAGIVFCPPMPQSCHNIPDIKKNFFWELSCTEEKRKRTAELRRLLYVAMTRAEEKLYLTGSLDLDNAQSGQTQVDNDFKNKIKNYIDAQREKKENYLKGDSILDNDTFFGLLLPAVSSQITSSFFNMEEIPVYSEEYIPGSAKKTVLKNDQDGLNVYIASVKSKYTKAKTLITPLLPNNHITPVSLKKEDLAAAGIPLGRGIFVNDNYSGGMSNDIFNRVDSLLSRLQQTDDDSNERFNSGSFGTIAHCCVEALLNKQEVLIPVSVSGLLSPVEFTALLEAGNEIARRFVDSPLGKIAQKAELRENEYAFRSLLKNRKGNEIFINGTIDLFFEENGVIHIVDFKTDLIEKPTEHTAQMACYHRAITSLFAVPLKKQCRIWLYYLRTGHAVEMTDKACQFDLEQRVFADSY
ncbi:MAG: UvrD-helicase domain-containing protein [Treponema sp.]|nr:UvrD-helicase domain-containing protein [Treponema sp.]